MGFAVPARLLAPRCALTAPFHPYSMGRTRERYIFCGTFRRTRSRNSLLQRGRIQRCASSRPLAGMLPSEDRTFLSMRSQASTSSGCLIAQASTIIAAKCRRTYSIRAQRAQIALKRSRPVRSAIDPRTTGLNRAQAKSPCALAVKLSAFEVANADHVAAGSAARHGQISPVLHPHKIEDQTRAEFNQTHRGTALERLPPNG